MSTLVEEINDELGQTQPSRVEVHEKPGSMIIHVTFPERLDNYYIKLKRPQLRLNPNPGLAIAALEMEHSNLQALQQAEQDVFNLPRPLYFDPDKSILVTSQVPGIPFQRKHSLATRILNLGKHELLWDLRQIGRALNTLHALEVPCVEIQPSEYARQLGQNVRDPVLPVSASVREALQYFVGHIERMISGIAETGTCHNDLTLQNMVFGDDRIGVLDFDGLGRNRPERDFATLYVSLVDALAYSWDRPRRLQDGWSSFVQGYGDCVEFSRMRPFVVHALVAHLFELAVRKQTTRSCIRRGHIGRLIRVANGCLAEWLASNSWGARSSWKITP